MMSKRNQYVVTFLSQVSEVYHVYADSEDEARELADEANAQDIDTEHVKFVGRQTISHDIEIVDILEGEEEDE